MSPSQRSAVGPPRPRPRDVAVVVPVFNAEPYLMQQLEALEAQTYRGRVEVVVADNGSTDCSVQLARSWAAGREDVKVIPASEVRGASHARNQGVASTDAELVCFCDADDVVDTRWLEALVEASTEADIVAGRLDLALLNSQHVRSSRPTPVTARPRSEPAFAPSGNMAVWRDVFLALGGFDESYLKSHDVELGRRAKAAGFSIVEAADAVVHYRLRSTLRGLSKQAFRAGRATVKMQQHHLDETRPLTLRSTVGQWTWLVSRLPYVLLPRRRAVWIRRMSENLGVVFEMGRQLVSVRGRRSSA